MKRFNLLPPEHRVRASRDRSKLIVVAGLGVLVLILAALYYMQMNAVSDRQDELAQINSQTTMVQQQVAHLRPYVAIHDKRTALSETSKSIYDTRVPWSTILEEVSLVIPRDVRLETLTAVTPTTMRANGGEEGTATGAANAAPDITFTGKAYSHKEVADFMTRLGLIPRLTNIQLVASTLDTASNPKTVTWSITASLRAYIVAPPSTTLDKEAGK